jgi:uncharacterized protein DUF2442
MAVESHKIATTDHDIELSLRRAKVFESGDRRVTKADYDATNDEIRLRFQDGVKLLIPRRKLQGLNDASRDDVRDIELLGNGSGLHWPRLSVDHYVLGLLEGIFGTKQWMAHLGRLGGSVRTRAKSRAARENGKKGGRPVKRSAKAANSAKTRTA